MQHKIVFRNMPVFVILFLSIIVFLAYPAASHALEIAGAEYFFNNDPGEGSGVSLLAADGSFDSPEESVNLSEIDTSFLTIGNHTLYVRFISTEGVWGMARPVPLDPFFRSPYNFRITGEKWIAGAEYFIDDDPGTGSGIPVSAADGEFNDSKEELELSGIDISSLSTGAHTLYLRLQDNEGIWGVIRNVAIEIYEPETIAGAEYFINNDPGPGNATPLAAKDGVFDSAEEDIDISDIVTTGLSEGVHSLYLRFKDSLNRWGALKEQEFAVGRPIAYTSLTPVQPATGDGRIPLSVIVADQSGSNTCMLKAEYTLDGSDNWRGITVEQGSVSASYGNPALDNGADYQIGGASGWIETGAGPNTVSFVWLSVQDLGKIAAADIRLRFTVHNGTAEHVTFTESAVFSLDSQAPDIPVIVSYALDPTGDTTPVLTWLNVHEAASYHLQVATDAGFNNIVLDQFDIAATSYAPASPLPYGEIYWHISAVDNLGNESPFSITDQFKIIADTASPSVILSYSAASPVAAGPLTVTAVFSEPLVTVPEIAIDQPGSTDITPTPMSGSGNTWSYFYAVSCADGSAYLDGTATVIVTNGLDYADNENTPAQNNIFEIDTSVCGSGNIIAAEYFFDVDPGKGNGIAVSAVDDAFDSSEESVDLSGIDTSSLKIGSHTMYVRFKSADGIWGMARPVAHDPNFTSPYNFRITGDKWIVAAEYFIDVDSGKGNCTPVSAADGVFDTPEEELVISGADISYLGAGCHTLYLRVQDNEGTWGVVRQVSFEIYEPFIIAGAEYFIDNDPGPGNGTPASAKDGSFDSAEEDLDITDIAATDLSEGVHTLYVRFKDQLGRWGAFSSHAFAVGRPVAFIDSTPVQPATGDGRIPLSVIVADQSGSNTCKLKIEYAMNGSDNWQLITIEEGSVSATYGAPLLDNNAEYRIGGTGGWIETSSGPNIVSFVWLSTEDPGKTDTAGINLRFTIHNGTVEHVTSTESMVFSVDIQAPDVPILLPYAPDPTGDTTPVLAWNRILGAGYYHLQIASDSTFSNILLDQSDIALTSYVAQELLPYGDIYWRVSAVDNQGNESFFSIADHFVIVQDADPPSVTLSYSALSLVSAGPVTITALFSEPLATVPEIAIDQPGNADLSPTAMTGSGTTWAYTYTIQCADGIVHVDGIATVTISNGFDYAGNENTPARNNSFDIDTSTCGSGNITGAEYFFDKDPGKGNGVSLQAADGAFDSPEESVDLSGIDTSSLTIGNHALYVRFKNADGAWGIARPISGDPLFDSPYNFRITGEKWVAGAEYFIDVDPGKGNAEPVSAADGNFDETEEKFELSGIDISYLSAGPHTLYLRVQDNEGTWGVIREISFEIYEPAFIAGAEYFIDDDQGPGNGIALTAKDGVFDSAEEEVDVSGIDVSELSEDIHIFYVRFKDNLGRWGSTDSQQFIVGDFLGDADEDGMPNGWEGMYGLNPLDPSDANEDMDNDGLSNLGEYLADTNPMIPDTDGDNMPDGWEVTYGLNPIDASDAAGDPDSDGLKNIDEYLNNTDPNNFDTDNDGMSDGDEVNYGNNPLAFDSVNVINKSGDVIVSLTGDNRLFVEVVNRFCVPKIVQFDLFDLDQSWYSIAPEDQSFIMMPFGKRTVSVQLHLPDDCNIPIQTHPFSVQINWEHGDQAFSSSDTGNLVVTPNPNIYPIAIPKDTRLAGNTIFVAWKTDIPATSIIKYRKLGDEEFIQVPVATDKIEHRAILTDLDYFTYYEFYTESHSSCGGLTATDLSLTKTGKAVKFVNNVNEFWVDRDYNQLVTLSITNTDLIDHTYQLSVVNDNDDIVVGFVGDGTSTRETTLSPGNSTDVELVIHAPDAQKTLYDIYLKIVSDVDEFDPFVDYSHAIVHVRPFVANLDIQPVESDPGMMTYSFRLFNYGDTLSDIEVYVDEDNRTKTTLNPVINHCRLENGGFVEFDIQAQEYVAGTVYARSGDYVVSAPFEIGCSDGYDLNTYTINDLSIVAEIKDWYCTNKMELELPFAIPRGFGHDDLAEAAIEVNFSLLMSHDKYDPHTVTISVNGEQLATPELEDTIPEGKYTYRIPTSFINLGPTAPSENFLTLEVEGIGEGQYIVATDFRIILNVDEMKIDLCVPPPIGCWLAKVTLPDPETKITEIGPKTKFRPGDDVEVFVKLSNDDNEPHYGKLTVTISNNSYNGEVPEVQHERDIVVFGGEVLYERFNDPLYSIPEDADDIEYTLSATFENYTLNETSARLTRPAFYVRTPLIIVHGVKGSWLKENEEILWMNLSKMINPIDPCDNWLNRLAYYWNGENWTSVNNITVNGPIKSFMKPLVNTFNGLEKLLIDEKDPGSKYKLSSKNAKEQDIFYFSYDWRQSNKKSAIELKTFIENVFTITEYDHANIIAHSMGGLVTKAFLQNYLHELPNQESINKVVFVGTPHVGAADAFPALKYGFDIAGGFYFKIFGNELSTKTHDKIDSYLAQIEEYADLLEDITDPTLEGLLQNILSESKQLALPSNPEDCNAVDIYLSITEDLIGYLNDVAYYDGFGAVKNLIGLLRGINYLYSLDMDIDSITDYQMRDVSRNWPSMYELMPSEKYFESYPFYFAHNDNVFNSYSEMKQKLLNTDGFQTDLIEKAERFHSDTDQTDLLALPIKSYAVIGCKKQTTTTITEIDENGLITFSKGDGDGRVPLYSALAVAAEKKYAALGASHGSLPSHKGVRLLLRSLLKGYETNFETSLLNPVLEYCENCCGLSGLRIIMPPPPSLPGIPWAWPTLPDIPWAWPKLIGGTGEFTWYTGNGVHIGILGSDYQITNDGVEIYVPEGSVYTLEFQGVDQEYLNIKFQLMSEGGVIKTYIFADLTLDIDGCGEVTFDLTDVMTDPVLRLDNECDGTFEVEDISPSYILNEEQSNDFIVPVTTANITGTIGDNDWYTSNVSITLTATDNTGGSGILATRYRFQGDDAYIDYAGPIQIMEPGTYIMTYYSMDLNLNKETEKVLEFKIDNETPQVLSIADEGYFSLGTANLSASWDIQTGAFGIQDVRYSLGTSPGSTDVIDWTSAGPVSEIQATGLSLVESCTEQIYINVQAVNSAGVTSNIASSDGVIVLESGGDPDGDGDDNESELSAGSNPCNELSFPGTTVTYLKKGFNLIAIPAEMVYQPDLRDWLPTLGDSLEIEKVMVYDDQADKFITLISEDLSNESFTLNGGEGLIVYAKQDKDITFTSVFCSTLDLKSGFNLVGFAYPQTGYTAFQLLNDLGSENVSSIQRYSTEKGAFETAGFASDGQRVGIDFPIISGEGYFVFMKQEILDFQ